MNLKATVAVLLVSGTLLATCPLWAHQDTTHQARQIFRVGGVGDAVNFTEITDVVVRGGNLIVLDRRESRVLEIGRSGELIREIGRAGEGPGDFSLPRVIGVLNNTMLWVIDRGLQRITFLNGAGRVVRTESRWPEDVEPYAVLTDSTVLAVSTVDGAQFLVILDLPGFSQVRTLDGLDWDHRVLNIDHPDGPESGRFFMSEPFGDWDLFGYLPDGGIWTVERPAPPTTAPMATLTVARWSIDGNGPAESLINFKKLAIPPDVAEGVLADIAETGYPRIYPKPVFTLDQVREKVFLPDNFTPIDDVVETESGELILKMAGHDNRWVRFHFDQGLVAQTDLPADVQPMVVMGNRVVGRHENELGIQTLVVLEIAWKRPVPE